MSRLNVIASWLLVLTAQCHAENLIQNGSFEHVSTEDERFPLHWDVGTGAEPLAFSSEHVHGEVGAMLKGDGRRRTWRQNLIEPKIRSVRLSAVLKAVDVAYGTDESAKLYVHVLYKNQPYSQASHIFADVEPGTYDWRPVVVTGDVFQNYEIEKIQVSLTGKFSRGRIFADDVELTENADSTPRALLRRKVADLREHLLSLSAAQRDGSVGVALGHLERARELTSAESGGELGDAKRQWLAAARAVSPGVWAVMFPDAVTDKRVEARMIYHGIARTAQDCDRNLAFVRSMGCNGVLLSLGSWDKVIYHSDVLPVDPDWRDFDALTYFVDKAHAQGIRVYGYIATFYAKPAPARDPGHIGHDHPDWLAKGMLERYGFTFPDPANPEVLEFMTRAYVELVTRYGMDGVGMDYIRYPSRYALSYDELNRRAILDRYGFDILEQDPKTVPEHWRKIQEYRQEKIGHALETIASAVKEASPGTRLIASLISEPDRARDLFGQDWSESSIHLTEASPMNYDERSRDDALIEAQRDICRRNHINFIPAIGGEPPVHQRWPISTWAARVANQRRIGCDGIIIYRFSDVDHAVAAFFGSGPFSGRARFPGVKER